MMKKILAIILAVVTLLCVGACEKKPEETELQYGKKYSFYNITFERGSTEFSDVEWILNSSNPNMFPVGTQRPTNLKEFEAWFVTKLDVIRLHEGTNVRYFPIPFGGITFTEQTVTSVPTDEVLEEFPEMEEGETMPYQKVNGNYVVDGITLYYSNGKVMYKAEIVEGYKIVYNYK